MGQIAVQRSLTADALGETSETTLAEPTGTNERRAPMQPKPDSAQGLLPRGDTVVVRKWRPSCGRPDMTADLAQAFRPPGYAACPWCAWGLCLPCYCYDVPGMHVVEGRPTVANGSIRGAWLRHQRCGQPVVVVTVAESRKPRGQLSARGCGRRKEPPSAVRS